MFQNLGCSHIHKLIQTSYFGQTMWRYLKNWWNLCIQTAGQSSFQESNNTLSGLWSKRLYNSLSALAEDQFDCSHYFHSYSPVEKHQRQQSSWISAVFASVVSLHNFFKTPGATFLNWLLSLREETFQILYHVMHNFRNICCFLWQQKFVVFLCYKFKRGFAKTFLIAIAFQVFLKYTKLAIKP